MRAVEEGRYLVRSANTGISGIVDPYGRVVMGVRICSTTAVLVGEVALSDERTTLRADRRRRRLRVGRRDVVALALASHDVVHR